MCSQAVYCVHIFLVSSSYNFIWRGCMDLLCCMDELHELCFHAPDRRLRGWRKFHRTSWRFSARSNREIEPLVDFLLFLHLLCHLARLLDGENVIMLYLFIMCSCHACVFRTQARVHSEIMESNNSKYCSAFRSILFSIETRKGRRLSIE